MNFFLENDKSMNNQLYLTFIEKMNETTTILRRKEVALDYINKDLRIN